MQISISNSIGGLMPSIVYVKKLIKAFKARVLSYPNSIFEADLCLDYTLTDLNDIGLLKQASLIVTPNAYNEGVLYDVVPNTTLGDMDVVRATTGTRVNEQGLIEVVPRNLLTYSEEFDNAAWTKTNVTVTANSTNSPYGALTADTLNKSATGVDGTVVRVVTATATGYVGSIFVKKDINTSRFPEFFLRSSDAAGENEIYVQLNTSTGATSIRLQFGTASVTAPVLINDYWRISFYALANSNTFRFGIRPAAGTTLGVFNSNATGSIIAWGAQVEYGLTATEYFPTTTRLNIPRIDYTNGSCPSLLVEPQRSNLLTYSEQFNDASWAKANMVIVANNTTSPDGTNNADKATASLYPSTSLTKTNLLTAASYTSSIYVKADTVSTFRIDLVTAGFAAGGNCIFNLTTLATTITNYGATTGTTAKIENVGNGWYRCSLTVTATALTYFNQFYPAANGSVFIWGAQLEAGSYPTSYIPTVASTVTRNADVISKTGISSLIGQTEGTIFLDLYASAKNKDGGSFATWLIAGDATNNFQIYNLSGDLYWFARNTAGGIFLDQLANQTIVAGTRYKIAIAYKSGDYALYINGVQKRTNTNTNIPTVSQFNLSSEGFGSSPAIVKNEYNSVQFYKTRLTNAELASLTTI